MGIMFDVLFLVMFTVCTIYAFLAKTQFQIPWIEWVQEENLRSWLISNFLFHPRGVLLVLVICRYIFSCRFSWKEYGAASLIACLSWYAFLQNGNETFLCFILFILGMKDISFRRVMQWYFIVEEILFGITIVASQTGYVENLVYDVEGRNIRMSFGFMYPTIFAANLFFLFLCIWYLLGEKWNLVLAPIAGGLALFVYKGCEARFTTVCFALLSAILLIRGVRWLWLRKKKTYHMSKACAYGLAVTPVLCALGMHLLSIFYDGNSRWMYWFNGLISNRLSLVKKGIDIYGFHLWGSRIPMIGYGGSVELSKKYFYLDSIFAQLSLQGGLVIFGIVLALLVVAAYRSKENSEWVLLWILAFAGIHGLFEEHLLSLSICPFLLSAFAQLGRRETKVTANER